MAPPNSASPVACSACGYDLKGLPERGDCPECGAPYQPPVPTIRLRECPPAYLHALRSGLSIVLLAFLVWCGLYLVEFGAAITRTHGLFWVVEGGRILTSLAMLLGWWRLTRRPPPDLDARPTHLLRGTVRASVVLFAVVAFVDVALDFVSILALDINVSFGSVFFGVWDAMRWLGPAAVGLHIFAAARLVRWIATRIPDDTLGRRAAAGAWVALVLYSAGALCWDFAPFPSLGYQRMPYLIGPMIGLAIYWYLIQRLRKRVKSISADKIAESHRSPSSEP